MAIPRQHGSQPNLFGTAQLILISEVIILPETIKSFKYDKLKIAE